MPYDESDVGFTWTRTAGFWPPLMSQRPRQEVGRFLASRVSAISSICEAAPESDMRPASKWGVRRDLFCCKREAPGKSAGKYVCAA